MRIASALIASASALVLAVGGGVAVASAQAHSQAHHQSVVASQAKHGKKTPPAPAGPVVYTANGSVLDPVEPGTTVELIHAAPPAGFYYRWHAQVTLDSRDYADLYQPKVSCWLGWGHDDYYPNNAASETTTSEQLTLEGFGFQDAYSEFSTGLQLRCTNAGSSGGAVRIVSWHVVGEQIATTQPLPLAPAA